MAKSNHRISTASLLVKDSKGYSECNRRLGVESVRLGTLEDILDYMDILYERHVILL